MIRALLTWLRKPPQGTRADGSPRRYRQPVDLTYVETRTYDSWSGTADQLFGDPGLSPEGVAAAYVDDEKGVADVKAALDG